MINYNDTIVAISSGNINQAISIIRLCGSKAINIIKNIFTGKIGENKTITFGRIINRKTNEIIDEVLINWFTKTNNYVGEPTVEINAHGGVIVTNKILNLILENGARLAERGEFTRRAFLNGKISLEKAEAINQLIHAKTNIQTKIAINQFDSKSNEIIENLEQELLKIISICEINIDYSEYNDIETIDKKKLFTFMNNLLSKVNIVIANSLKAIDVYKGVNIAIIGEPNVGKSSLFNLLIDKDKAIVTNIAGTTRDVLEDSFEINGILFNIIDTAGLRATKNVVESIGIDRAYKAIEKAKIIIHLFDLKTIKNKLDPKLQKLLANKRCINVLNKIDEISDLNSIRKYKDYVWISAKTKRLYELRNALVKEYTNFDINNPDTLYDERKLSLLNKVKENLENGIKGLNNNFGPEVVIVDLNAAWQYLRQMLNKEYDNEALLDNMFKNFCLGK